MQWVPKIVTVLSYITSRQILYYIIVCMSSIYELFRLSLCAEVLEDTSVQRPKSGDMLLWRLPLETALHKRLPLEACIHKEMALEASLFRCMPLEACIWEDMFLEACLYKGMALELLGCSAAA